LIVEDEIETAEMLAEMMTLSGYQVKKSFGGASSINLISRSQPDILLLDVMMPDLSGLEILRYVRRDPVLTHIPVIVISAKSLPKDIEKGLGAGANAYLTKPVAYADLHMTVTRLLS
jgi:CheY-like chemotaxis protein